MISVVKTLKFSAENNVFLKELLWELVFLILNLTLVMTTSTDTKKE